MADHPTRRRYAICLCVDKFMLPPAAYLAERLAALPGSHLYDVLLFLPPSQVDHEVAPYAASHGFLLRESTAYEKFADIPIAKRGLNQATFQRLVLPTYLTGQYDKILYMDVDMEVRHPIAGLFELEMSQSPFAAVVDWRSLNIRSTGEGNLQRYQRSLGLDDEDSYFNAGVLLIHMDNWHAENLTERAVQFLLENPALCWNADQSALNAVSRKRFLHLTPLWNMFSRHWHQMQLSSVSDAIAIHYIRFQKHWAKAGIYSHTPAFADITGWLAHSPWPTWQNAPSQKIAWHRSSRARAFLRKITCRRPPGTLAPEQRKRRQVEFLQFCASHRFADMEQGIVGMRDGVLRLV